MDKFVNKLQTLYYRIKREITNLKTLSVEKKGKTPLTIEYTLRRSTRSFPPQLNTMFKSKSHGAIPNTRAGDTKVKN
jgi:hypothetical protein